MIISFRRKTQILNNKMKMKIIIKTYINGEFIQVASYDVNEVKQIRHHKDGLEIVLNGHIKLYNDQSIIEFN